MVIWPSCLLVTQYRATASVCLAKGKLSMKFSEDGKVIEHEGSTSRLLYRYGAWYNL